jgi:protoheme IX farnesyltransferase
MENHKQTHKIKDYFVLCKPKVVIVMLITAWVGMFLATQRTIPLPLFIFSTLGIALAASGAAVINHLVDRHIDAKMQRTQYRPVASGRIKTRPALIFSLLLSTLGISILVLFVNTLSAILTFLTVLGYGIFYTSFLKRKTPQNIVIGGLAGAMPPLLGWTCITGDLNPNAWLLVLIIFTWTPPHFWALAIYRRVDYQKANIPMLPVTHGVPFTKLCVVLYTLLLLAISLFPYMTQMSGLFYLISALILGALFLKQTLVLYKTKKEETAFKTFSFSILYLLLLFAALLLDHFLTVWSKA